MRQMVGSERGSEAAALLRPLAGTQLCPIGRDGLFSQVDSVGVWDGNL